MSDFDYLSAYQANESSRITNEIVNAPSSVAGARPQSSGANVTLVREKKTPFGFRFILGRKWEKISAWAGCMLAALFTLMALSSNSFAELASAVRFFLIPGGLLVGLVAIDLLLEVLLYSDDHPESY